MSKIRITAEQVEYRDGLMHKSWKVGAPDIIEIDFDATSLNAVKEVIECIKLEVGSRQAYLNIKVLQGRSPNGLKRWLEESSVKYLNK